MAEIIQLIKIALCTASFFFLCVAATRMNLNKADRAKQFLMPVVALVYCILTLCFLNPIYQILFGGIHMLEGLVPYVRELQLQRYLIYLANLFMVVGFLVVKAIALPILRRIWERLKELAQATSGKCYEYDKELNGWFVKQEYGQIRFYGKGIYCAAVAGSVVVFVLSQFYPGMPAFQDGAGNVKGIHIFGEVTLSFPALIEIAVILLAAWLSFRTTKQEIRRRNHFTWGAIKEVAVLFIGIFITMQPALMLLKSVGPELGLTQPSQLFWATGALSSFLDNTPTYLVFLTTAGTLGITSGIATSLGTVPAKLLSAISCGAVFMGANTYIGNAPNFMVKSISDENGVNMPSFFGYMLWSLAFLVPVFIIDTFVFFL